MIVPIIRTALVGLRRDRAALSLGFVLPIVFFSIFAVIFGGQHDTVRKIPVIVVDQDQSRASQQLVKGLQREVLSSSERAPRPRTACNNRTTLRRARKPQ